MAKFHLATSPTRSWYCACWHAVMTSWNTMTGQNIWCAKYLLVWNMLIYVDLPVALLTGIIVYLLFAQILMSHWTLLQVTLGIPWTNTFAIMKVYHMIQKPCTTVTREPRGHSLLKTRLCTWTSVHMEGQFKYNHTISTTLIHSLCVFQLNQTLYWLSFSSCENKSNFIGKPYKYINMLYFCVSHHLQ